MGVDTDVFAMIMVFWNADTIVVAVVLTSLRADFIVVAMSPSSTIANTSRFTTNYGCNELKIG